MRPIYAVLIFAVSTVASAARPALTEPMECLRLTKTIRIEDDGSRFHSIQLLDGKKIRLLDREGKNHLEVVCGRDLDAQSATPGWQRKREVLETSGLDGVLWIFTMGMATDAMLKSKTVTTLTDNEEFPIRTMVRVNGHGSTTVYDSVNGTKFSVICRDPGFSVEKGAFALLEIKGDSLKPPPSANAGGCEPTSYTFNIKRGTLAPAVLTTENNAKPTETGR